MDWTGRYFLVELRLDADPEAVAASVTTLLGKARRLDAAGERDRIEAFRRGEPWMRAGETLKLSRHEAGVLARRFAGKAAKEAGLDEEQSRRLAIVAEEELNAVFQRLQGDEKGIQAQFRGEWPSLVRRVGERSLEFATREQSKVIQETLDAAFERRQ